VKAAALAAAVVAVLLSACATGGGEPTAPEESEQPSIAPFAIDQDFPDPDVLEHEGTYFAYATNIPGTNVQLATSTDLESWEVTGEDALPALPEWSIPGKTWAPDVTEIRPGEFVMYFTAASSDPALQCIGVATAQSPTGPFEPRGDEPLVCPGTSGGAIDASTFIDDDGTPFLLFKNDGNCCGLDTWLHIVELSPDGLELAGDPIELIKQDQEWEGTLIEAPTLVSRDGSYILFYSANDYGSDDYAIGFATADDVTGPFTKADGPFLSTDISDGRYRGPGGQDVVTRANGDDVLVFHSWNEAYVYRGMNVVPISWSETLPFLE
jgi:arabinan endo-1,5-alpha-L-arabinosidase